MVDNSGLLSNVLYQTDPELYLTIDGVNSWKTGIKKRGDRVAKYRRYERGDHDSNLTEQMRKMLRLSAERELEDFNVNYCRIVIDKMVSRLKVSEVTTSDEEQDNYINELLARNNWASQQSQYYRAAIRDGDSYVMIDPATLKWVTQPAYDGFSGVVVIYTPMEDKPIWACKLWSESDTEDLAQDDPSASVGMRLAVYQPDRITYWKGIINTTEAIRDGDELAWYGDIPIVHFVNLADNYTRYGESEIRAALPLQDVLNRTLHSMVMASEFSAFKIAWSIGMELDKSGITPGAVLNLVLQDSDGNTVSDMTTEQIEFLRAVRVGEFSESDISQYTNQLAEITKHISQNTQTPIYGVSSVGSAMSGDALKQLEIGFIGKIKRFKSENITTGRRLVELSAWLQNIFNVTGLGSAPELDNIDVNWSEPEIIDTKSAIESILAIREKAPGLFDDDFIRQRIGAILGLSQAQIREEGDKAMDSANMYFDQLTGAAGNVAVV